MSESSTVKITITTPNREPLRVNILGKNIDVIFEDIKKLVQEYMSEQHK